MNTRHNLSNQRQSGRVHLVFIGLVAIVVLFSVGKLAVTNHYATKSNDLAEILIEQDQLREQNDILKSQLARETSLSYVLDQAQKEGYVNAKSTVFLLPPQSKPIAFLTTATF